MPSISRILRWTAHFLITGVDALPWQELQERASLQEQKTILIRESDL
jgi:hypothetical protein